MMYTHSYFTAKNIAAQCKILKITKQPMTRNVPPLLLDLVTFLFYIQNFSVFLDNRGLDAGKVQETSKK